MICWKRVLEGTGLATAASRSERALPCVTTRWVHACADVWRFCCGTMKSVCPCKASPCSLPSDFFRRQPATPMQQLPCCPYWISLLRCCNRYVLQGESTSPRRDAVPAPSPSCLLNFLPLALPRTCTVPSTAGPGSWYLMKCRKTS